MMRLRFPDAMNKTIFAVLAAAFSLASPERIFAQERVITLDEAYGLALGTHEAIKIAGEGVSQAGTNIDKALSAILPKVTAEGNYTRFSEQKTSGSGFILQPDDSTRVDLKVAQPLYSGGRDWTARRQAKLLLERSREGVEGTKEDILSATATAYYNALKAEKDIEIKEAALKRADERLKVASARFRVGEVTRSAVLREEAEKAGAEAELINSRSTLADAKNLLKRLINVQEDFKVSEPPLQKEFSRNPEELINGALESRADYKQLLLEERYASEGITYAKSGYYPSVRLEGLYSWRDQNPQTTFFQEDSLSASLVLTYPIFEGWLRKAEVSEARSKLRETEFRRISLKRDIEVEVRDAVNNIEYLRSVIESYRKQVSFAEEDYKMVFEQFKFGLATTVDVIDADTVLIQAQRSLMAATYNLEIAVLDLKYKTGALLDEIAAQRQ